jgi:hypothetical protein
MPLYTFELHDGERPIGDESGLWFADRERALDHAQHVAGELMRAREVQTRSWRLDVYEDGSRIEEIPFSRVDHTLDHLPPALRSTVERSCDTLRNFKQVMSAARDTVRESRALVARSRGKPYLATEAGRPTIRTSPPLLDHDATKGRRGTGSRGR